MLDQERIGCRRERLHDAMPGKLLFATVREDPAVEIQWLQASKPGRLVVVGSGGCTALTLLSQGPCEVAAVDINPAQNHVTELKMLALRHFAPDDALAFLGGRPLQASARIRWARDLLPKLQPATRAYLEQRNGWLKDGILNAGLTERFVAAMRWCVWRLIQSRRLVNELLAADDLGAQERIFRSQWNNWRWRGAFRLMLNPFVMGKALDPRLFVNADVGSISEYFLRKFEHGITRIAASSNYFLHHMLTGYYPADRSLAPPYLAQPGITSTLEDRLTLVDGSMTSYLNSCEPGSVRGFALSNICEWMSASQMGDLFAAIRRAAQPEARVVMRHFLGNAQIPAQMRDCFADESLNSDEWMANERSLMQRGLTVLRVKPSVSQVRRQPA